MLSVSALGQEFSGAVDDAIFGGEAYFEAPFDPYGDPFASEAGLCHYLVERSKAKIGCPNCPAVGSVLETDRPCNEVQDCRRKYKDKRMACPDEGPGFCKVKGKRESCFVGCEDPDAAAIAISHPSEVRNGDSVRVKVTVENKGCEPANIPGEAWVGEKRGSFIAENMAPGERRDVLSDPILVTACNLPCESPCPNAVRACTTLQGDVNPENDCAPVGSLGVVRDDWDLEFAIIDPTPTRICKCGGTVFPRVRIYNRGRDASPSVKWHFTLDADRGEPPCRNNRCSCVFTYDSGVIPGNSFRDFGLQYGGLCPQNICLGGGLLCNRTQYWKAWTTADDCGDNYAERSVYVNCSCPP
ncbi:MAG: hypothetical protein C4547_03125 [Phycisphaerales bacterium]|nr:MAG: hypothetical protein C4547_03125 [Phycisphaerales bacterium]